jgi:hypothetical protein
VDVPQLGGKEVVRDEQQIVLPRKIKLSTVCVVAAVEKKVSECAKVVSGEEREMGGLGGARRERTPEGVMGGLCASEYLSLHNCCHRKLVFPKKILMGVLSITLTTNPPHCRRVMTC